ncbi:MAG: hypothetical protein RLZZ561_1331 [Pseudomonadota bacterium]|jgi:hypothetical protein
MSPYLLQAPVIAMATMLSLFAAVLLFCSVTDALRGDART